jgi:hypothetical protein
MIYLRPAYDWTPDQDLYDCVATLENPIFYNTLPGEEYRHIISLYPPVKGLSYNPPQTSPKVQQKIQQSPVQGKTLLRQMQYSVSAVLWPIFDIV